MLKLKFLSTLTEESQFFLSEKEIMDYFTRLREVPIGHILVYEQF